MGLFSSSKKKKARRAAAKLEAEKKRLGLEQAELQREKEGIVSRQLGARRSAIGRAAATKIGAKGGGGLMSSPEQQQRAKDIEIVSGNIGAAEKILRIAQKNRPTSAPMVGSLYGINVDPFAAEKKQLETARADIQRVNRGERPLLQAIQLPAPPARKII